MRMTTDRRLHVRPATASDREGLENLWLLFRPQERSGAGGASPFEGRPGFASTGSPAAMRALAVAA